MLRQTHGGLAAAMLLDRRIDLSLCARPVNDGAR